MTKAIPAALHHTSFLVRDVEKTARQLSDALGIGPWNIWTIAPAESRVHGQAAQLSFRIAFATVGGGTCELVSPHSGRSALDDHLAKHGDGFHHICFVYASLEDQRKAKAELVRQGRELVQESSAGDVFAFTYFRFAEIGSLVEILYIDPTKLPPPEAVIGPSA
jgi:catechol 2,3-dioxygenase-like lactoylglutathione lyase family enzyme